MIRANEKMSVKLKDEKPSPIVACCQSSNTTPENSIVDYIEEDFEASNNNRLFHATDKAKNSSDLIDVITKKKAIDFVFPKRPKVDIEFQNIEYRVKQFSFQERRFGE